MEKISVIIPFYNSEKTLERCLRSVLNQTYKNIEILMIDDCSKDRSVEIVRRMEKHDSRIKLFQKEHGGVSAARNLGLDKATGEFVQFVDSDDHIDPKMFETMLSVMHKQNADIVVCNYSHPSIKSYIGNRVLDMTTKEDRLTYYQNTFTVVVPWNKLYRRSVITQRFDETVHFCEDELFGLGNMMNAKKIVSIDTVLYHYYVAPPDTPLEELSCINKIAYEEEFWKKKGTYWYRRRELLSRCEKILSSKMEAEDVDDFLYIRIFDFMIWELVILSSLGIEKYGLIREMQSIFLEDDFIKSLMLKEKYGIHYKDLRGAKLNKKVEQYVSTCLMAYDQICEYKIDVRPFYIFLGIFAKYFMEPVHGVVNNIDFLAKMMLELELNSTREAEFVNKLHLELLRKAI